MGDDMKDLFKNLKATWRYAKSEKYRLIAYIILNLIMTGISVIIPIFAARQMIYLTESNLERLLVVSLVVSSIELFRILINHISRTLSINIFVNTYSTLIYAIATEVLKLNNKTLDKNGSGVFIQRITNDTFRMSDIYNFLTNNMVNIISDLGMLFGIFVINKWAFLYALISITIITIIERIRVVKRNETDKKYRKEAERITGFIGEMVRGSRDLKMLNAEESFLNEMGDRINTSIDLRFSMNRISRNYGTITSTTKELTSLGLILLLIFMLSKGYLISATALIIYNYYGRISSFTRFLGDFSEMIKDFNLSCNRVFEIVDSKEFEKETFGKKHLNTIDGDIEYKDVHFSYGDNKVLKGLSFKVKKNETVAIVGKSGSGKTTIFNLLNKFYLVDSGEILLNNININELDRESIRENITMISQNPYIFNMSIRDNLRLVKKSLKENEMIDACKRAYLHDFIMTLPNGYDTIVGEGGVNLSGGQKQRLAIARALIQNSQVILFDEATSALDNETQGKIQDAINDMKDQYTIIIVAHRLSTIINADRILYLEDGIIKEEGTHKELMEKSSGYKVLYEKELNK